MQNAATDTTREMDAAAALLKLSGNSRRDVRPQKEQTSKTGVIRPTSSTRPMKLRSDDPKSTPKKGQESSDELCSLFQLSPSKTQIFELRVGYQIRYSRDNSSNRFRTHRIRNTRPTKAKRLISNKNFHKAQKPKEKQCTGENIRRLDRETQTEGTDKSFLIKELLDEFLTLTENIYSFVFSDESVADNTTTNGESSRETETVSSRSVEMSFDDEDINEDNKKANSDDDVENFGEDGNGHEKVQIGNETFVSASVFKRIDWSSYTVATRRLLTAVFPRSVLATHSLTGKPSKAFPDKPGKEQLNPDKVQAIIETVCRRCKVPENLVRASITTKLADESKMLRQRNDRRLPKENERPREAYSDVSSTT